MTRSVEFDEDAAAVKEFEHPNGETGVLIGLRLSVSELAAAYDIDGVEDDGPSIMMPLKHKADGATNFESYSIEEGTLTVDHTDEQFERVRGYLQSNL